MLVQFTVDTAALGSTNVEQEREALRTAASYFLHLAGDLPETEEPPRPMRELVGAGPTGLDPPPPPPPFTSAATAGAPPPPPPPPAPSAAAAPGAVSAGEEPPHTFPTSGATANGADSAQSAAAPPAAPGASTTTSHSDAPEFDKAGLPWDGRIHQARKGVKKDGTWKVQKGADPALVESVIKELVARKGMAPTPPAATGSAPPPPPPAPPVPLPAGQVSLPLPPVGAASDMSIVIPATAAPVPAPAAPAVGAVSTGYRELIAKCSAATKAGKLDGAKLATIVQRHGCPSVQALRDMPHLIPLVETDVDVELLS